MEGEESQWHRRRDRHDDRTQQRQVKDNIDQDLRQRFEIIDDVEDRITQDHMGNKIGVNKIRDSKQRHEDSFKQSDSASEDFAQSRKLTAALQRDVESLDDRVDVEIARSMRDDGEKFADRLLATVDYVPPPPALVEQALVILEAANVDMTELNESILELATSRLLKAERLISTRWQQKYNALKNEQPVEDFSAANQVLKQQLNSANEKLTAVNATVGELRKAKLESEQEFDRQVAALQQTTDGWVLKITKLGDKVEDQSFTIQSKTEEIQRLQARSQLLSHDLTTQSKATAEALRQLGHMQWERDQWAEAAGEFIDEITAHKQTLAVRDNEVSSLNGDNEVLRQKLEDNSQSHRTEMEDLTEAHSEAISRLKASTSKAHEEEISRLKASISETHNKEISDLKASISEAHEKEISDLKAANLKAIERGISESREKESKLHDKALLELKEEELKSRNEALSKCKEEEQKLRDEALSALEKKQLETREKAIGMIKSECAKAIKELETESSVKYTAVLNEKNSYKSRLEGAMEYGRSIITSLATDSPDRSTRKSLDSLINPLLVSCFPIISPPDIPTLPKAYYIIRDEHTVLDLHKFLTSSSIQYLIFRLYVLVCEKSYNHPTSIQLVSHLANRLTICRDGIVLKLLVECIKELRRHVINTKCPISSLFMVSFSRLVKIACIWAPEIWARLGVSQQNVLGFIQGGAIQFDELIGKLASLQDVQGSIDVNQLGDHFGKYHVLGLAGFSLVSSKQSRWIILLNHELDGNGLLWITLIEKKYCLPDKNWDLEAKVWHYFIKGPAGWEDFEFNFNNTEMDSTVDEDSKPIRWWSRFIIPFQPLPEEIREYFAKKERGEDPYADIWDGWVV